MNQLQTIARRIMIERGLLPDFSPAVLAEVAAVSQAPVAQTPGVRDLRELLWASIDNDTSRDLDQLSVAERWTGGAVKIRVAVADVDAVVRPRSAIDQHARTNTTSVYTAAGIFPMLPERLSTDLTSLGQDQDRLAIGIEWVVDADGTVRDPDVYRALVRNRAKLAYGSVAAWLGGSAPAPPAVDAVPGIDEQIRIQDRVAQSMRTRRFQHGALSLQTFQSQAVFAGNDLADLRPDEPNRAKELIEDLMVAANGVTANFLAHKGFPSLRRVLRSPERWGRIVALAKDLGDDLPTEASGEALAAFLTKRKVAAPDRFADLSLSVVKLLGRGEYVLEWPDGKPAGHFALAVTDYTHSTAPNRRFPDLVTQRLLKAAMAARPVPYTDADLRALAMHCTVQETQAAKVERHVNKSGAALLLASRIGQRFDALVTGASERGTWVRIAHPATEGKVVRGFKGLDVGDRTRVELVSTDVERGFIDFAGPGGS
ncbi:MAG: RNB domain-containing ribonuclease [Polyangiaceae bacterium]|jgi:exoribonuclease-2